MAKTLLRRVYYDKTEDGGFGIVGDYPEYVYKPFPKAMYHATLPPKLIKTKEQLDKLGKDWSPAPIRAQDKDEREPQDE